MADEPTSASGGSGSINVRNIRAERQLSREMTVERLTVNTGEERNAESDLLNEVRDVLTEQTTTLGSTLNDIENIAQMQLNAMRGMAGDITALKNKGIEVAAGSGGGGGGLDPTVKKLLDDLRSAIVSLNASGGAGGGGEDGGGGGGSGGPGDSAAQARQFRGAAGFADAVIDSTPALHGMRKAAEEGESTMNNLFRSGMFEQFRANLINLGDQIQSAGNNLMDMNKVYRGITERFQLSMEAATSGVAEMGEVFWDIMPGIRRGGDNLTDTLRLVRDSLDNDLISTVGIVGSDLMEVSEAIHSARMTLRDRGVNAADRLSFRDLNAATQEILALERRRDVTATLDSIVQSRALDRQLDFAQMIATNTGRTADEVIRMNAERGRALANLEAGGILQGGERENFERAINVFASTPGMGPFAEMLAGIARSGGSMELFLANNPEMATDLAAMNQIPQLRGLLDAVRGGGGLSDDALANALMSQAAGFGTNRNTGVAGASVISDTGLGLAGAGNMAREFRPDSEPGAGIGLTRRVQDFVANNLAEVGIIAALGLNTMALLANTRALGGGLFGGLGRGRGRSRVGRLARIIGRGRGGLLGRAGLGAAAAGAGAAGAGAAGAGAAGAAGRAGLGAAARGAGRAGLGAVLRGIPGLGLLAGLAQGGYYGLVQGDWTSAALAAGSGVAGTIPGLGTAASLGLSAALVAREGTQAYNAANADPMASPSVGPTPTGVPSTQNAGIRTETQRLMVEHNRLLGRIATILEEQTGIFENIETNTVQSTVSAPPGFFDSMFGGDDAESASPAR